MAPQELTRARLPPVPSAVFCWVADSASPKRGIEVAVPWCCFLLGCPEQSLRINWHLHRGSEDQFSIKMQAQLSSLVHAFGFDSLQIGMMLPVTSPNGNEKERKGP